MSAARRSTSQRIESVESLVLVTIVAALIWLLAEGRTVRSYESWLDVRFEAPSGRELRIDPEQPFRVEIRYAAAASRADAFEDMRRGEPLTLEAPFDPEQTDPIYRVNLLDELRNYPALSQLGVEIRDADPAERVLRVEPMVRFEAPVTLETPATPLAARPALEPDVVTVTAPRSIARRAENLSIRLASPDLTGLEPNTPVTLNLPVQLPPVLRSPSVRVEPETVAATFTLSRRTRQLTLTTIPVLVKGSPAALNEFRVTLDADNRVLRDLVIQGPATTIAAIESGQRRIEASVRVSIIDLERGEGDAPVELDLPPDVTLQSLPPTVRYTARRVDAAETDAP